eukprot:CAMPEP_0185793554 /NCGR_PEP_ID=MMETSP1174-20130828/159540_1 /TAXON_ID=35687 /ORGANISM="Dictyocha speculum, Strain CCMP1381" /LENGTH=59 /DNA_ID=CAMNT_0028488715 /DNA_START=12 /DNA_END=188 /DNA_ORIENTATION=+
MSAQAKGIRVYKGTTPQRGGNFAIDQASGTGSRRGGGRQKGYDRPRMKRKWQMPVTLGW